MRTKEEQLWHDAYERQCIRVHNVSVYNRHLMKALTDVRKIVRDLNAIRLNANAEIESD